MLKTEYNELMSFKCEKAIKVFSRDNDISEDSAAKIWPELMKWLWIGNKFIGDKSKEKPKTIYISEPLLEIDKMWHSFILCTKEYTDFCHHFFGKYIHHEPEFLSIEYGNDRIDESDYIDNINYVTKNLGPKTAFHWFVITPLNRD
jgi:hypothetical protein